MPAVCTWFVADGDLPPTSSGQLVSHEALCALNTSEDDAAVDFTVFFEDRDPLSGFHFTCPAQRTVHVRLDTIQNRDGEVIPKGKPYALEIRSSIPIIVQHSRMDTSQAPLALFTTMGFPG
ncbi:hypothetical protein SD51_11070 [Alicyclobacillus tengchongensis]|nr:hypothetical protein SD51_11070 [Alicyclobacillus tengchongensis]